MPTSDGSVYAFKYVNGHPKNTRDGLQTVTAFGVLSDVDSGYPMLLSEMTILTALRTAATSALAAKYLAPEGRGLHGDHRQWRAIGVPGAGVQGAARRQRSCGFTTSIRRRHSAARAIWRAGASTSCRAARRKRPWRAPRSSPPPRPTSNTPPSSPTTWSGSGVHINAVGGDCPGKTELHRDILLRSSIFVEYPPQTRIEGEIQQLPADHPVTELWQVITGGPPGRRDAGEITLFDSVGFATEDFSALRYVRDQLERTGLFEELDLLADPDDPRDLFGMILRAGTTHRERGMSASPRRFIARWAAANLPRWRSVSQKASPMPVRLPFTPLIQSLPATVPFVGPETRERQMGRPIPGAHRRE